MLGPIVKSLEGKSPDQLVSLLRALGFKLSVDTLDLANAPEHLKAVARQAGVSGSKISRVRGTMKNGDTLDAFFVITPKLSTTGIALVENPGILASNSSGRKLAAGK